MNDAPEQAKLDVAAIVQPMQHSGSCMVSLACQNGSEPDDRLAPIPGAMPILVTMPLPRPGHFAEREELDAALAAKTAEALRLFLDRHPQSRYRAEAEQALARLGQSPTPR